MLDLRHVASGGLRGLVRRDPALARVHVRRVPVPPVVRLGDRLERAVPDRVSCRSSASAAESPGPTRPGSRCLISCNS